MYAMTAQARRIQSCVMRVPNIEKCYVILVGNDTKDLKRYCDFYKKLIPMCEPRHIVLELADNTKNYKPQAQLIIGQMRTAAFTESRTLEVDYCWSLDSDVLPRADSLDCMLWSLKFCGGIYSVATCPYPSQGGGGFLGGRGSIYNGITPDWADEERVIPDELKSQIFEKKSQIAEVQKLHQECVKEGKGDHVKFMADMETLGKEFGELDKKVKNCPPQGNVFQMNGKYGWKKRGWLDQAYPATGWGAILPTDWCGFGCTLLNRRALEEAHFDGYDGGGTEDLYICWHRWYQVGLKMNVITHCPADHVIRNPGKEGYFVHQQTYHETEGETVGHLRIRQRPWHSFDGGELFDERNDAKMVYLPEEKDPEKPISDNGVTDGKAKTTESNTSNTSIPVDDPKKT